jgi:hypothetical protein
MNKACPFCQESELTILILGNTISAQCDHCGTSGPKTFADKQELKSGSIQYDTLVKIAYKKWNTRVISE